MITKTKIRKLETLILSRQVIDYRPSDEDRAIADKALREMTEAEHIELGEWLVKQKYDN
jgi:hypothetical protein